MIIIIIRALDAVLAVAPEPLLDPGDQRVADLAHRLDLRNISYYYYYYYYYYHYDYDYDYDYYHSYYHYHD